MLSVFLLEISLAISSIISLAFLLWITSAFRTSFSEFLAQFVWQCPLNILRKFHRNLFRQFFWNIPKPLIYKFLERVTLRILSTCLGGVILNNTEGIYIGIAISKIIPEEIWKCDCPIDLQKNSRSDSERKL